MFPIRSLTALLLVSCAWPALAAEAGDVRAVTLYSGGVAEIVRSADMDGSGSLSVDIPLDHVNDVLKSLVVRDPSGRVGQMNLAGSEAARSLDRSAPFTADDLGSLPSLLSKIRGARVRLTAERTIEGIVLGVMSQPAAERRHANGNDVAQSKEEVAVLSVLEDGGTVRTIALTNEVTLDILDADIAEKVREAAGSLQRSLSDTSRTVEIDIEGEGKRTVDVDYVVAAPVWKSSHRLVVGQDGKGTLQSWAIVENASGSDWQGVRLVLSSGSPVTLSQNLFEPFWKNRPQVPVFVDDQGIPEADRGSVARAPMAKSANMAQARGFAEGLSVMADSAFQTAEVSGAAEATEAVDGDVAVDYVVPSPVDLDAGDSLSMPIVSAEVPAERIAIFKARVGETHPTAAVRVANETGAALPAGLVTVYDTSGYVGDSTLLPVPVGEERLVRFALDRKMTVRENVQPESFIRDVKIDGGILRYRQVSVEKTRYAVVSAASDDRKILIEHPKRQGWTIDTDAKVFEADDAWRIEATIPAGAEADVQVTMTRIQAEGFALVEADAQQIIRFQNSATDHQTREALAVIAKARNELAALERRQSAEQRRLDELVVDQARVRDNVGAIGEGDQRDRYLDKLQEQEREIEEAQATIADLRNEIDLARGKLSRVVASF